MTISPLQINFTMAALEAATQPARVRAPNDSFRSQTLAHWVAGSGPAMVNGFEVGQ
jgi:hypothetical protein